MNEKLRILITGFGPFPGAPFNPTEPLVARLMRLRRPAFSDVQLSGHIFPVTYTAVDRQLPQLLAKQQPHAVLMFGLATRTAHVRIETRATPLLHCGPMPTTPGCAKDQLPAAPMP
jgi:pyroglutamyl-peptidase